MKDQIYHIFSQALNQYNIKQTNYKNLEASSWGAKTTKENLLDIDLIIHYERICMDCSLQSISEKSNKLSLASHMGTLNSLLKILT
jgi:hypothetical protein